MPSRLGCLCYVLHSHRQQTRHPHRARATWNQPASADRREDISIQVVVRSRSSTWGDDGSHRLRARPGRGHSTPEFPMKCRLCRLSEFRRSTRHCFCTAGKYQWSGGKLPHGIWAVASEGVASRPGSSGHEHGALENLSSYR